MQPPAVLAPDTPVMPPDHKQLPDEDGSFVHNSQEHPQANLLTECLLTPLQQRHLDGQFFIGCDMGLYWRSTDPPLNGCKAPDWFYVPGVPPMLHGELRRSYVLWQEVIAPFLIIELVSGDGSEERDTTPFQGKFWVYEQGVRAEFYAIFEVEKASVEVHRLVNRRYEQLQPNAAGRFLIEPLGIELGIWQGTYRKMLLPWLRVWDAATGKMLPLAEERAETAEELLDDTRLRLNEETERAENERRRADDERKRADEEKRRAESAEERLQKLAEKLRALGADPEA